MDASVTIAAVQLRNDPGEAEERRAAIAAAVARAADVGAHLVVLPELSHSAYVPNAAVWGLGEALDGPSVAHVRALARDHRVHLGAGLVLREGEDVVNAYVLADDAGEVVGVVRKRFPETYCFLSVDGPVAIDTDMEVPAARARDLCRTYADYLGVPAVFVNAVGPLPRMDGLLGGRSCRSTRGGVGACTEHEGRVRGTTPRRSAEPRVGVSAVRVMRAVPEGCVAPMRTATHQQQARSVWPCSRSSFVTSTAWWASAVAAIMRSAGSAYSGSSATEARAMRGVTGRKRRPGSVSQRATSSSSGSASVRRPFFTSMAASHTLMAETPSSPSPKARSSAERAAELSDASPESHHSHACVSATTISRLPSQRWRPARWLRRSARRNRAASRASRRPARTG